MPRPKRRIARKIATVTEHELPLRITVIDPVPGVALCLRGKDDTLVGRVVPMGGDATFDFTVRVKRISAGAPPRFLGEFADGPTGKRFVYIRIGTLAGQPESCWTRAAKIPLYVIDWPLIHKVIKRPAARLEARVEGRAKNGGPACATVPLLGGGWKITPAS